MGVTIAVMTSSRTTQLPSLILAYRRNDAGDHPGGGHCVGLPSADLDRWTSLLDQYLRAFVVMTERSRALLLDLGDGWGLTRPVLFEAHHVCEVALKAALVAKGSLPTKTHSLSALWAALDSLGGLAHLLPAERTWAQAFLAEMQPLAANGFTGRYPDTPGDLGDDWCCLVLEAVQQGVEEFVALVRP